MTTTDPNAAAAQRIAEGVRAGMYANDRAVQALGMAITEIAPGRATVTMTVRADMLNGFAIIHGGLVATLADTAFAYACNSYNEMTVASGFSVDLMAPAHEGDVLTAVAHEVQQAGRTGVYDVVVSKQNGQQIGVFRGRSYRLKGRQTVPGLTA
ncbi:MAG: hydroxyphenylacetyl-CoA thioesterase PaaI [Pseudomonadota bacterium]|jgi:acyl-CoA thioesterase